MRGATFSEADLRDVSLWAADLEDATIEPADLAGADLEGADLTGVDLAKANLDGAVYGAQTRWPDGFDADAAGATIIERGEDGT